MLRTTFAHAAAVVTLLALPANGCIRQMRADIQTVQTDLASVKAATEKDRQELESVLAQASAVLQRNSADQGLQIEQLQARIDTLDGAIAETKHGQSGVDRTMTESIQQLQEQLAIVARASGVDAPLDAAEIPAGRTEHYNAATQSLNRGEFAKARALFSEFIVRYPSDPFTDDAQYGKATTYRKQGNLASALMAFRRVVSEYREGDAADDALYEMGETLTEMRRCNDAKLAYETLVKGYPQSTLVKNSRARLKEITGGKFLCAS